MTTFGFAYFFMPAPLPYAFNVWQIQGARLVRDPAIAEIQRLVRSDMKISAQGNIGAFFSQRTFMYPFPAKVSESDGVILHLEYPYTSFGYAPFNNPYATDTMPSVLKAMQDVVHDQGFGLLYWERNWLLAVRGAEDRVNRQDVQERLRQFVAEYEGDIRDSAPGPAESR